MLAGLHDLERGRRRVDRELHVHDAVLEAAGDLVAGVAEDLEHPDVVGQDLGDELLDADLAPDLGEVLEQQLADAAVLVPVLDEERDLGRRRPRVPGRPGRAARTGRPR